MGCGGGNTVPEQARWMFVKRVYEWGERRKEVGLIDLGALLLMIFSLISLVSLFFFKNRCWILGGCLFLLSDLPYKGVFVSYISFLSSLHFATPYSVNSQVLPFSLFFVLHSSHTGFGWPVGLDKQAGICGRKG